MMVSMLRLAVSIGVMLLAPLIATADSEKLVFPLASADGIRANGVLLKESTFEGRRALELTMESDFAGGGSNTLALVSGIDFGNGTIEFDVASGVNADSWFFVKWIARGFAGLAFRVDPALEHFESLYLRPTNGEAEDPERRAHAVQYFSYPDWDFQRFRAEAPGRYEAPAPIGPERWIHVRVEVDGATARLFIDDHVEPILIVSDLKLGANARGGVGFFIDMGTRAFFSNLVVTPAN